jgi:hypothetical protein
MANANLKTYADKASAPTTEKRSAVLIRCKATGTLWVCVNMAHAQRIVPASLCNEIRVATAYPLYKRLKDGFETANAKVVKVSMNSVVTGF